MYEIPVEQLRTAERILQASGAEDEDIAKVVDVAGAVVREYGLAHLGHVNIDASEKAFCVKLRYRFTISPQEAEWLYNEFLDRLYDLDVTLPTPFIVTFEGQTGTSQRFV